MLYNARMRCFEKKSHIGFLCCVVLNLVAAQGEVIDNPAVEILYHDALEGHCSIRLYWERPLCVKACGHRSMCDVLKEQVLGGCFLDDFGPVPCERFSPVLWQASVRDLIFKQKSFFSQDIKHCFEELRQKSLRKNTRHARRLDGFCGLSDAVFDRMYPEGKRRLWWVEPEVLGRCSLNIGDVALVFSDGCVLSSILVDESQALGDHDSLCLLDIKVRPSCVGLQKRFIRYAREPYEECVVGDLKDFMMRGVSGLRKCVALVFFPKSGTHVQGLYDLTGKVATTCYEGVPKEEDLFLCIIREATRAFSFRKPLSRGVPRRVLMDCDVLKRLCWRSAFPSQFLRDAVLQFRQYDQINNTFWNDLGPQYFRAIRDHELWQWSVVDCEGINFADESGSDAVWVVPQGEDVFLRGCPLTCGGGGPRDDLLRYCLRCGDEQESLLTFRDELPFGVSVTYVSQKGVWCHSEYDLRAFSVEQMQEGCAVRVLLFSALKEEILRGIVFKEGVEDADIQLALTDGCLLDDLCVTQRFFSQVLRDALPKFAGYGQVCQRLLCRQTFSCAPPLEPKHFDEMYPPGQTLRWSLVPKEERFLVGQNCVKGHVVVAFQGALLALHGSLVPAQGVDERLIPKGSVFYYKQRQRLSDLSKKQRRVVSVGDPMNLL